jgi:cysteine desulfurase/selenocysteine lyase
VKLVTVGHVSNVTWTIVDVQRIKTVLRPETLFVIDASQSLSHLSYDLKTLEPDFFIGTAHKCFWYTGVGMCVIHPRWIETLSPARGGWGVIQRVDQDDFAFQKGAKAQRREPGTPNLIGAVSLSKAIEYIHSQWWIAHFRSLEKPLIDYALSEFKRLKHIVRLIGSWDWEQRVWIFSFVFVDFPQWRIAQDLFAQKNICLRWGGHCTHPFWKAQWIDGALRISLSVYNDLNDLKKFFQAVEEVHDELKRFST